jgi:hypothetical protein
MPKLPFQMPELPFQMPKLPFQMPEHSFQMPEHRFQMPELRFQNFPLIKFGRLPRPTLIRLCSKCSLVLGKLA